jgi:hypothetical protein
MWYIATSLVFYPPGYDGGISAKEFNDLRIYYRAFISNNEKHLYPGYTNFEPILTTKFLTRLQCSFEATA